MKIRTWLYGIAAASLSAGLLAVYYKVDRYLSELEEARKRIQAERKAQRSRYILMLKGAAVGFVVGALGIAGYKFKHFVKDIGSSRENLP